MDKITKKHRSWNMSLIRSENTKPEKIVRQFLLKKNVKFKLYQKNLPGKPDIIVNKAKIAIFVNGCFWHQHKGCKRQAMPKSNQNYWEPKLIRNIDKQRRDRQSLKRMGWQTNIIWECQVKNQESINKKLQKVLV